MTVIKFADAQAAKNGGWRDYHRDPPPQNKHFQMKLPWRDAPCGNQYVRRGRRLYARMFRDERFYPVSGSLKDAKWRPE